MFSIDQISYYLRNLPVDARIEVILANLLEKGISLDDLIVQPIGIARRRYHKDWEAVKPGNQMFEHGAPDTTGDLLDQYDDRDNPIHGKIIISVNREGLYDYMPEGIIHQPQYAVKDDPENTIKEIKEQRAREQAARKFFMPIEQEFYRLRIALEMDETKYFITPENIGKHELIQQFWDIPSFLSPQQICSMVYLLPLTHNIAGDFKLTELCFESILNVPVSIRNGFPLSHDIVINKPSSRHDDDSTIWDNGLGSLAIGVDFILSGGEYLETIPSITVRVGPVANEELSEFLEAKLGNGYFKGTNRLILDYLIEIFMPFEADTVIEVLPKPRQDSSFALDDPNIPGSLMGFDAVL